MQRVTLIAFLLVAITAGVIVGSRLRGHSFESEQAGSAKFLESFQQLQVGTFFPDILLAPLNGGSQVTPSAILPASGLVILADAGCRNCAQEMDLASGWSERYEQFMFIVIPPREPSHDTLYARLQVIAPVYVDVENALVLQYGVGTVPCVFKLGQHGVIEEIGPLRIK